ncbi:hypothetical protein [Paenibacillus sp. OV219]|uniref:hypothetical protein n=1 Tax=Paenibacillus sp. OV219 TaxID=1884377 RepID=UPI0008C46840|nr:hypothetical protein [Paenibacillus sp. OV219]SEP11352.1 hypothetical protein SAMN05518847_11747 [Paenibacillus sp. OV219]
MKSENASKRYYKSGEFVPFDGIYGDVWGGWLPLIQGDLFPAHPEMGISKWLYHGSLATGLPEQRKGSHARRTESI